MNKQFIKAFSFIPSPLDESTKMVEMDSLTVCQKYRVINVLPLHANGDDETTLVQLERSEGDYIYIYIYIYIYTTWPIFSITLENVVSINN